MHTMGSEMALDGFLHHTGFKQAASADIVARGHALIQNLRNGFSTLTMAVTHSMRLATAWAELARAI
jgi:hypothetical protein